MSPLLELTRVGRLPRSEPVGRPRSIRRSDEEAVPTAIRLGRVEAHLRGRVGVVTRKMLMRGPTGTVLLDENPAHAEVSLQELMKDNPELLPVNELGLTDKPLVVGRETPLPSGRVDLVLLGSAGDLALVEFKTGPANPDFRSCIAQLLDYGSDLWGMPLETFDTQVAQTYFNSRYSTTKPPPASLEVAMEQRWGTQDDAVSATEVLRGQLAKGAFLYVVVAQRVTEPVRRTIRYLNNATRSARFAAVELTRYEAPPEFETYEAFEARVVVAPETTAGATGSVKDTFSDIDALLELYPDATTREGMRDLLESLNLIPNLTIYLGTTGCSLRVSTSQRTISLGWIFPPGKPRWMGLTNTTLGWYDDGKAPSDEIAALESYLMRVSELKGGQKSSKSAIRGYTFSPAEAIDNAAEIRSAISDVVTALAAA